jgi:hypothetical protein
MTVVRLAHGHRTKQGRRPIEMKKSTRAVFVSVALPELVESLDATGFVVGPAYHGQKLTAHSWLLIGVIV